MILLLASLANAQVALRVAVDTRAHQPAGTLSLEVDRDGVAHTVLTDDGQAPGDQASDGVFVGETEFPGGGQVRFRVTAAGQEIGRFTVEPPESGALYVPLKATPQGVVVDHAAGPQPGWPDYAIPPILEQSGTETDRAGVLLTLTLQDTAGRLSDPTLTLDGAPLVVESEGSDLYTVVSEVPRTPFAQLLVQDGGETIADVTLFLPAAANATIALESVAGEEGVRLVDGPETGGATLTLGDTHVGGTAAPGTDRLPHVLWVAIALFAVAFGYTRRVVASRWTTDVQPILGRLNRWLDQQEDA